MSACYSERERIIFMEGERVYANSSDYLERFENNVNSGDYDYHIMKSLDGATASEEKSEQLNEN